MQRFVSPTLAQKKQSDLGSENLDYKNVYNIEPPLTDLLDDGVLLYNDRVGEHSFSLCLDSADVVWVFIQKCQAEIRSNSKFK